MGTFRGDVGVWEPRLPDPPEDIGSTRVDYAAVIVPRYADDSYTGIDGDLPSKLVRLPTIGCQKLAFSNPAEVLRANTYAEPESVPISSSFTAETTMRSASTATEDPKRSSMARSETVSLTMARTGLRMMPTFPSPSLKFRTAGFPQYGFKAGVSDGAFLQSDTTSFTTVRGLTTLGQRMSVGTR